MGSLHALIQLHSALLASMFDCGFNLHHAPVSGMSNL